MTASPPGTASLGAAPSRRPAPLAARLVGSLLTVPEVRVLLGVSRQRVLQLIRDGRLDATKAGRQYLVTAVSVQDRLTARAKAAGKQAAGKTASPKTQRNNP